MMILTQWILHIQMHVEWKKYVWWKERLYDVIWEKMLRLIDNVKLNVHNGNIFELCYDMRNSNLRNIVVSYTKLMWHEFNIVVKTNCDIENN